jgi:glycosyl transferase family 25
MCKLFIILLLSSIILGIVYWQWNKKPIVPVIESFENNKQDILLIDKNNGSYNFNLVNPLQFTTIGVDAVYMRFNTNVKLGNGKDKDGPLIPNYFYISNIDLLNKIIQIKPFINKTTILIDSILFNEIKNNTKLYNKFMLINHKILERKENEMYIVVLLNWMKTNYASERKFIITDQNIYKTIESYDKTYHVSSPNNLVKRIYELTEKVSELKIDKYYVINLKKSTDRWSRMMPQAENAGIELTRFNAVNGKEIKLFEKSNKYLDGLPMDLVKQPGSVGCAMSHITLWGKFRDSEDENIVIFEDDIIIPPNFKELLDRYVKQLPIDWDMCFLGNTKLYGIKISDNIVKMVGNNGYNYGLFGYIINKKSVNKLLNIMTPMSTMIDNQLTINNINKLNCYILYPYIITHDDHLLSTRLQLDNMNPKRIPYPPSTKYNIIT